MKNHRILTIFLKEPSHKNHRTLTIQMKNHYINITRINIFVVINQTNTHKGKMYNHCTYTQIIIKKNHNYIKKFLHTTNIISFFCFAKYKNDKFIIK